MDLVSAGLQEEDRAESLHTLSIVKKEEVKSDTSPLSRTFHNQLKLMKDPVLLNHWFK